MHGMQGVRSSILLSSTIFILRRCGRAGGTSLPVLSSTAPCLFYGRREIIMAKERAKNLYVKAAGPRSGAQILVECLEKEGVEVIFGYPGAAVLPLFDLLFDGRVRFVLTRHEQGASHAADGYARVTGKPGVCLATSGPGAVNLVTGLATAYMDSVPLVAVTGQVKTTLIGNDAFQEADVTGITRPITKHNYLVKDAREIPGVVREAFYLASSGRPGPVLIDLPVDVQQQVVEGDLPVPAPRQEKITFSAHRGQIHRAAELIAASKRPLIIAGGGAVISGAGRLLVELADKIRCPAAVTLMGMGVFPSGHEFYLGMPGMHGTVYANRAISESDLIIAVGVRFDDRVTGRTDAFAPRARIIQIDIDPSSIGKNICVELPITADASAALARLLETLKKLPDTGKWLQRIARLKKDHPLSYKEERGRMKPQSVIEQIYKITEGRAIIVTDVGQNQMWTAQWYPFERPRRLITSGGLGTMGFGLPAAMGVKIASPRDTVFLISGDGSIQMNLRELATCAAEGIDIKIAVLNNGCLGMVRQWQELFYKRRYSQSLLCSPDFVMLARSYGLDGALVRGNNGVRPALKKALSSRGTFIVDFRVDRGENVMPMVPAGEAIDRMIGGMA